MDSKKKLFLLLSGLFLLAVIYIAYDLARQTTKPWGKKNLHRIGD